MARYLKFAALTAGACLLLALAAAAIIGLRVDPNDYKGDIIRLAQEKHQRTLTIPGDIKLTFWPRVGANLGQVSLSERASGGEFAAIDSARISVALLPLLLRQEVVIDRLDIRGMRASVVRHADGSMNIGDLTAVSKGGGSATRGAGGTPIVMAIDSIRIGSARLLFDDRKSGRTLDISHLNIDSGPIAPGVASRVALSANIKSSRPALTTALTLKSKFTPDRAQRRIAFSDVDANMDLSFKDARVKLKGKLDVDLDRDEFAAELKGRFDDSTFDIKAGLRAAAYQLTLHIDKVDLDRYQNRLVPDALPDDPTPPAPGDAFDLSPLAVLRANGGIHVGELKVGTMHATNVRAAMRSDGGRLALQPIGADLYGGSASGALTLDFSHSASTPNITFVQNLKGIQVGPLLKDLMEKSPVEGRGDILIDVNTSGASTAQMRQALSGTAAFQLSNGTLNGVDIGAMVLGAKEASGLAANGLVTHYKSLGASFTIADGIAHNDDLAAQASVFQVAGAGDIDLARERIDYTLACTLLSTGVTLPVRLSGPWSAVSWRVDTGAVSGAAVRQKARDKLKKTIRGLLKG